MKREGTAGTMFWEALAVVILFMLARAAMVAAMPADTMEAWTRLDAWKTVPRLAGFLALLALNQWRWKAVRLDFATPAGSLRGFLLLAGTVAVYLLGYLRPTASSFSTCDIVIGLAATPFVALFEEYAFRGAILEGLRRRIGTGDAILVSSLLFAVYHVQSQAPAFWPALFGVGVILANLRVRGIGLGWLMVVHFLLDAYFYVGMGRDEGGAYGLFLIALAAYAVLTRPRRVV